MNANTGMSEHKGVRSFVRKSLLRFLGVPIELTNHDFWSAWIGGESWSGESVTVNSALSLSTVWSCVRLISETIATLPLGFYARNADGSRASATDHPLYAVLHAQPNADMTAVQFWEVVVTAMLLGGTAYAEKLYAGPGSTRFIGLDFLNPAQVARRRLPSGAIEYEVVDESGRRRRIAEADMFVVTGFSLDGRTGLSTIAYARNVFGSALATNKAAAKMFGRGLLIRGTFETDHIVKDTQREAFQERLNQYQGAINAGGTPLLEAGIKYKPISINPDDAQLLESRAFAVEEICRWFRVPPFMVGHSEKSTSWGTGIEQQMIGFVTFCLRPWLTRIEQAIRKDLLTPAERAKYFAEFSIEGLLRADSAARAAFYASGAQNGWITRNEIRRLENLPPVDGGDIATAQSNLLPLGKLGGDTTVETSKFKAWMRRFLDIPDPDVKEKTDEREDA